MIENQGIKKTMKLDLPFLNYTFVHLQNKYCAFNEYYISN